jgi:hypothetical protein
MKSQMAEDEWFASKNSYLMLKTCRRSIRCHPRKGRLFAVACCHRISHLLSDPRSRAAVGMAAQYADGLVSGGQLQAAHDAARAAHADAFKLKGKVGASAEWAAQFVASADAWFAASRASSFAYVAAGDPVIEPGPEKSIQAWLLRCVFGQLPFHPLTVESSWLAWNDGGVAKLGQTIYDERAFNRMPELADAFEAAGCKDEAILDHCRGPGPHVRGCWVVDLLLAKE